MKNNCLIVLLFIIGSCSGNNYRKVRFNRLVGVYKLDTEKTFLGKEYIKDSLSLDSLLLFLNADSTFYTNKKVEFWPDTSGRWNAGTAHYESWNYLYFKSFDLAKYEIDKGSQFGGGLFDSTEIEFHRVGGGYWYFKKIK